MVDAFFNGLEGWLASFLPVAVCRTIIKSLRISYTFLTITIPVVIAIRILGIFGFIDIISDGVEPIMKFLQLPGEAALIWAISIVASLYGGLATFAILGTEFTVLETTVLACLMLGTHSIFVEMLFVAKTGCRLIPFTILRIGMTVFSAFAVGKIMTYMGVGSDTTVISFIPTTPLEQSWSEWAYNTTLQMAIIPVIAFLMIAVIDILHYLKITDIIVKGLSFLLSPLRIKSGDACQLTLVGVLLGLAFGGALLVEEAKKGKIPNRDIAIVMMLLCNVHAAIEDNILLALLGTWLWGAIVMRVLVCYAMVAIFGWVVTKMSDNIFYKYLFKRPKTV